MTRFIYTFAQQPINASKRQHGYTQSRQGGRRSLVQLQQDQLASQRHQSDQNDGFDLNDTILARRHFDDGMFELHGDQHGQDHPEDFFERFLIQRVQSTGEQPRKHLANQLQQSENNDDRDNHCDDDRHDLFEALVKTQKFPIFF